MSLKSFFSLSRMCFDVLSINRQKALKADRAGLAAKSTEDRQQRQEEGVERGLRGEEKDAV